MVKRIFEPETRGNQIKWVPCHLSLASPKVADGGKGLHMWRVATYLLKKRRPPVRCGSAACGLGGS